MPISSRLFVAVGPGLLAARRRVGIKNPMLHLQGLSGLSLALEQNPQLMATQTYKVTHTYQLGLPLLLYNPHKFPGRHKA